MTEDLADNLPAVRDVELDRLARLGQWLALSESGATDAKALGAAAALRLYYASDIHGTEVLWKKFLNAPRYYKAQVLVMGGDITGKIVIPLVEDGEGWSAQLLTSPFRGGLALVVFDLVLGAIIYYAGKAWRASQGIDLSLNYLEIPPE